MAKHEIDPQTWRVREVSASGKSITCVAQCKCGEKDCQYLHTWYEFQGATYWLGPYAKEAREARKAYVGG